MLFGTFIQAARARERQAGVDYREMACYAARLTPYVESRLCRTVQRLERLYLRMPPAPIDEHRQREQWEKYRVEFVAGLRNALDHMGEMLAAVGCSEEELESLKKAFISDAPSDNCAEVESSVTENESPVRAEDEGEKITGE